MALNKSILLSSAYMGPISYFAHILQSGDIFLENYEHYTKQTYRNRCKIITSNGIQDLIVPVVKVNGNRTAIRDIQLIYSENWQLNHWRTIVAAYNNSPYFLFYKEDFKFFFQSSFELLSDYNKALLHLILRLIGVDREIPFTKSYLPQVNDNMMDLRNAFNPKQKSSYNFPPYTQVFSEKHGFHPDLSILDLLFNLGPDAKGYLQELSLDSDHIIL